MTMGRKTKLTPERQDKICELLRVGNYFDAACGAAGIHKATGYEWLKKGENAQSGQYYDFHDAVKRAEAEAEAATVVVIKKASIDTWQAAAWWLERRFPSKWGKRVSELTGKDGSAIDMQGEFRVVDYRQMAAPILVDEDNDIEADS